MSLVIIFALLIGLGAGIAIAGDHVTQHAHLYCRNCSVKPVWPSVVMVMPKPTWREKRRARQRVRELNMALGARMGN